MAQDFRVGVITTSVYQTLPSSRTGRDRIASTRSSPGGCSRCHDERASRRPSATSTAGTRSLLEKFRRLVVQGTSGSGQETPFEAVRLAVTPPLASTPLGAGGQRGLPAGRGAAAGGGGLGRGGLQLHAAAAAGDPDGGHLAGLLPEQAGLLTPVDGVRAHLPRAARTGRGRRARCCGRRLARWRCRTSGRRRCRTRRRRGRSCATWTAPTSYGPGFRQRAMAERFDSGLENLDSICRPSYRDTLVSIASLASDRRRASR